MDYGTTKDPGCSPRSQARRHFTADVTWDTGLYISNSSQTYQNIPKKICQKTTRIPSACPQATHHNRVYHCQEDEAHETLLCCFSPQNLSRSPAEQQTACLFRVLIAMALHNILSSTHLGVQKRSLSKEQTHVEEVQSSQLQPLEGISYPVSYT